MSERMNEKEDGRKKKKESKMVKDSGARYIVKDMKEIDSQAKRE